jgi:dihydrofolate reductase
MISAIVAVNEDWGIGYNNDLLEHIPADLKFFKTMTTGKTVVMGLNTWDSLPKKPLPNRFNIIIEPTDYYKEPDAPIAHMDLDTFINSLDDTEYVVIGGGSIYRQLLPYCDRVYVTKIYKKHENVDTYFPNLDEMDCWKQTPIGELETYKDFTYQFWQYDRNS